MVRVIATTYRELAKRVADGAFREDLFNRRVPHQEVRPAAPR